MGDETRQFASRFSDAVSRLTQLADDAGHAALARQHGARLADVLRDALDAVGAVYGTGTKAVRNWPEQSRRVLGQLASLREALDRSGVDDRVRRMARALVDTIEAGSDRR